MSYQPRTLLMRRRRDQILAALHEHGPLNTTMLGRAIGFEILVCVPPVAYFCHACERCHSGEVKYPVGSAALQPTMVTMERHGEITRHRAHTSDIYLWALGPSAPAPIPVDELEAMLA